MLAVTALAVTVLGVTVLAVTVLAVTVLSLLAVTVLAVSVCSLHSLSLCLVCSPLTVPIDRRLKGDVIGRELRAIALAYLDNFNVGPGISCYAPMINIIRCLLHYCQLPQTLLTVHAATHLSNSDAHLSHCTKQRPCQVRLGIDSSIALLILAICAHTEKDHSMNCEYPDGSSRLTLLWQGSDVGKKQ